MHPARSQTLDKKWLQTLSASLELEQTLRLKNSLVFDCQWLSAKAYWIAQTYACGCASGAHTLCLSADSEQQSKLMAELQSLCPSENLICFPSWETLPSEPFEPSLDVVGLRLHSLWKIATQKGPWLVSVNIQSLQQTVPSAKEILKQSLLIQSGQSVNRLELIEKLISMGYKSVDKVQEKGQFAKRATLLDLFSPQSLEPIRLEWWADDIEEIKIFDPSSQKSLKNIPETLILPAHEKALKGRSSLIDYFDNCSLCLDDPHLIEDRYVQIESLPGSIHEGYRPFLETWKKFKGSKVFLNSPPLHELGPYQRKQSASFIRIKFDIFSGEEEAIYPNHGLMRLSERFMVSEMGQDSLFWGSIKLALDEGFSIKILVCSQAQKNLAKENTKDFPFQERIEFAQGYLSSSLIFNRERVALIAVSEYDHYEKLFRPKLRISHTPTDHDLLQVNPGDPVVHLHHGIGVFRGCEKIKKLNEKEAEYLLVEFAHNSKVYVPLDQAYLLTRYQTSENQLIELHELGSGRWKKQWMSAMQSIQGYAKQLLELYALRQLNKSLECPEKDSEAMELFESAFAYDLTEDQSKAIESIKKDLFHAMPMDRLLCGDVGYGKTEVAMRAAFKMVIDAGAQVACLAPTTVLALQHFETFSQRMKSFGVEIALLSRFTKPKEKKEILKKLEEGQIDILIGTHRLLSQDVQFKKLGLILIDEEQRFGVRAKEHLKMMRQQVNCLTLSATPIPRTLHLSLMGAKELSTIATPPHDRQPITTLVCQWDIETLRAALSRELGRGGQAFYVHNDIESLPLIATKLSQVAPNARIGIVHGQMKPDDIEKAFHRFKSHEIDILVATTIVETGIDIPNANTIFIEDADHFGLSDLYQLRGRVGRWNRRAWAYLLYPAKKSLSEIAKRRLEAIQASSGYGSGMKVALRDMENRGCGELLGESQSGHVSSIGFSLYCRLLQKAVARLQGEVCLDIEQIKIDHNLPSQIPSSYIPQLSLRLEIYQRVARFTHSDDLIALKQEIIDRFGPLPLEARFLLALGAIRYECAKAHILSLKIEQKKSNTSKKTLSLEIEKNINGQLSKQYLSIPEPETPEALILYIQELLQFKNSSKASTTLKIKADLSQLKKNLNI